ncbi:DNA adenine methylase [uncultured Amphritea sp.]|uniref:DNA adenine methylase n=1 Tax=uncultured Amphritea sp. TaxID=981605 RepID=UPI0025D2A03B|nr:DNA adenine methylase [uncultured Amphritea sp.]
MKPIMRYHGAKFRLANWVISFFPEHSTYVEPFGGAAGVLLQKPRSLSEVYNDLDEDIVNVFRVMQDQSMAHELRRRVELTPYSRSEFELSYEPTSCTIERARRTLIRAHMGFGSAGATKHKTGFRIDSARLYGTAAHLWAKYPVNIDEFTQRLQSVVLENKDAVDVIDNHDREDTLFYVDPPYLHSTRKMRTGGYYAHEMSDDDHLRLLDKLVKIKGMVVLSGYASNLYRSCLIGWEEHQISARISAGRGTDTRVESLWLNAVCADRKKQTNLFNTKVAL